MKLVPGLLLVPAVLLPFAWAQEKDKASTPPAYTVVRAGALIDGKSEAPRRDQVIFIRGNRIDSVRDAARAQTPAVDKLIDGSKGAVLPTNRASNSPVTVNQATANL